MIKKIGIISQRVNKNVMVVSQQSIPNPDKLSKFEPIYLHLNFRPRESFQYRMDNGSKSRIQTPLVVPVKAGAMTILFQSVCKPRLREIWPNGGWSWDDVIQILPPHQKQLFNLSENIASNFFLYECRFVDFNGAMKSVFGYLGISPEFAKKSALYEGVAYIQYLNFNLPLLPSMEFTKLSSFFVIQPNPNTGSLSKISTLIKCFSVIYSFLFEDWSPGEMTYFSQEILRPAMMRNLQRLESGQVHFKFHGCISKIKFFLCDLASKDLNKAWDALTAMGMMPQKEIVSQIYLLQGVPRLLDRSDSYTFGELEKDINYFFNHPNLLRSCLTPQGAGKFKFGYQRLEFLGDGILEILGMRFVKIRYPQFVEKDIIRAKNILVCGEMLNRIGHNINLQNFYYLNRNPPPISRYEAHLDICKASKCYPTKSCCLPELWRPIKLFGDLVEALVAAIFIDCGLDLELTAKIVYPLFASFINQAILEVQIAKSLESKKHTGRETPTKVVSIDQIRQIENRQPLAKCNRINDGPKIGKKRRHHKPRQNIGNTVLL